MSNWRYRQGVAAVVLNQDNNILICQRADQPDHYQFPQGGVKKGEEYRTGLLRELKEEIGSDHVEILMELPEKTRYLWTDQSSKKRYKYDGQEHQWFVVRLRHGETLSRSKEFSEFRWVPYSRFLDSTSPERREVYGQVLEMINFCALSQLQEPEKVKEKKSAGEYFEELVRIMEKLRDPEKGCPWDLEQTHESVRPYLIEETYEAVEAIDRNDMDALKEELGDMLLQILFHSRMESEVGGFTIIDVIRHISEKMVRRHPHVFGDTLASDSRTVLKNWEKIKKSERGDRSSILDGIPAGMPALLKARRMQERAKSVGFDWQEIDPAMDKVREEIEEFFDVCRKQDQDKIEDELGDIFFALVNISRFVNVDSEKALERTVRKFSKRFRYIEKKLGEKGIALSDSTLEEMDKIWDEAKSLG